MVAESTDYRDIRSLAVHREDVVTAFETNRTGGSPHAVLRVLPPFAGRMRARLHLEGSEGTDYNDGVDEPRPIHLEPAALLVTEELPAYPRANDTESDLRADPEVEYSIDRHHERHTEAVGTWREAVASAVAETATLSGSEGSHPVEIRPLG